MKKQVYLNVYKRKYSCKRRLVRTLSYNFAGHQYQYIMAKSGFRAWAAYQKSFRLASSIFRMSASFPKEERYSLTDQIRRSSRSVSANLAECYGRRRYKKHFVSKLSDCIAENFETQVWFDFALDSSYITEEQHESYIKASEEVGKLLSYMERHPEKFIVKPTSSK